MTNVIQAKVTKRVGTPETTFFSRGDVVEGSWDAEDVNFFHVKRIVSKAPGSCARGRGFSILRSHLKEIG